MDTLRPVLLLVLATAGCATGEILPPSGGEPSDPQPGTPLPCDVDAVLAARCRGCHSDPTRNAAPMPLLDWDDTQAPAKSDASLQVWERMQDRIHDPEAPMPPPSSVTGALSPEEMVVLDAWLQAGAPAPGSGEACEPRDPPPDPTPLDLPCDPNHSVLAFGSAPDGGFEVAADADNLYQCYAIASPFADAEQAVAIRPVIDDSRVVHHIILYAADRGVATPGESFPCASMPGDVDFVWGWAPGGTPIVMPDGIGLRLPGPDQVLLVQIHYYNGAGHTDVDDASGLELCTVSEPLATEAGFVRLGASGFEIPARTAGYPVTGECAVPDVAGELRVLGAGPHMHGAGASFTTEILRGGDAGRAETLVHVENWAFDAQTFYPLENVIRGGDTVRTTCVYDNPGGTPIRTGERTEDEMCLNFVMVTPFAAIGASGRDRCVDDVSGD